MSLMKERFKHSFVHFGAISPRRVRKRRRLSHRAREKPFVLPVNMIHLSLRLLLLHWVTINKTKVQSSVTLDPN